MPPTVARLPLALGQLDHYTLIVADAAASAAFHVDVLGFRPLRIQRVNAGSAPPGQHDMLNHVLELPDAPGRVLVITEGLNPDSIFSRYLDRYGPGVHHVAYEVDDLESARARLLEAGIRLTSDAILRDPLTGLRQVFVAREHAGYFVELIERTAASGDGAFTEHNMEALARTMTGYLGDAPAGPGGTDAGPVCEAMPVSAERVLEALSDPSLLPRWTGHRLVRPVDGQLVEVRMHGDVPLDIRRTDSAVVFTWTLGGASLTVAFEVEPQENASVVRVTPPAGLAPERRATTRAVLAAELRTLRALLGGAPPSPEDAATIDAYHLAVHVRSGV
jgi:catechol 2,3-dioxygenase-like lactoylglutathione lyase family enzyme